MASREDQQLHNLISDINLLYLEINKTVLSKHGMRQVRYYTMQHLAQRPGLSLGQLSQLALVDRAALSRMVFSMEKEGLIRREANGADRRLFKLFLTREGEALYATVQADMEADIDKRFNALGEKTKASLIELNQILKRVLSDHVETS